MGSARLQANALVRLNGTEHRITRQVAESIWQVENVNTGRIIEYHTQALLTKIETRELVFISSGPPLTPAAVNLMVPEELLEKAKLRRLYVLATLNVPNTRKPMEEAIRQQWKELGESHKKPGWVSVWGWKRRYLAANGDFRALIDNHHRKGYRREEYPSQVRAICKQAIETTYLKRERTTIKTTLEDALARIRAENKDHPKDKPLPMPSRRFITRLIDELPAFQRCVVRKGRQKALMSFRSVRGTTDVERPLQRAEIDHTVLDLFVIDERTFAPLGRPCLTLCIDRFTRCVLGIYLGFNPPSYLTVAQCLKDAVLPKATLRERYPEIQSEWIAYGVMDELVVDQGQDFHAKSLEHLCYSLPTNLTYSPRKQPWFKGTIERFFGTLNRGFAHTIPGTTFANIVERGDYDAMRSACVTLSDLHKFLRMWIVDVYHQTVHSELNTTPHAMWKAHMRTEDIRLPNETVYFDAFVGTVHKRKLTHKGIQYADLFYNSRELEDVRMRYGAELDVEIRVDESDLGSIYVFAPGVSTPIKVGVRNPQYASGLSLWAHSVIKKRTAELHDGDTSQEKLDLTKQALREWVQQSLQKKKGSAKRAKRFLDGTQGSLPASIEGVEAKNASLKRRSIPASVPEPSWSAGVLFAQPIVAGENDDELPTFQVIPKQRFANE